MPLDSNVWVWCIRAAGIFHFVTLALASVTPIPPNWDENLAQLPEIHRRFAIAQNVFIGAVIAAAGLISLCFAPQLVEGTALARVICACIALWWGGRLVVLPWLARIVFFRRLCFDWDMPFCCVNARPIRLLTAISR